MNLGSLLWAAFANRELITRKCGPLAFALSLSVAPGVAQPQSRWVVDNRPVIDITATGDTAHPFHLPVAAIRLADGTIVVADAHGGTIAFFDSRGQPTRTFGRLGGGPGEFRHIAWLGLCQPGEIHAWDRMRRKMVIITENGVLARELDVSPPRPDVTQPEAVSCHTAGHYVFQSSARGGGAEQQVQKLPVRRGVATMWIGNLDGSPRTVLGDIPTGEVVILGGGGSPRPLGPTTSFAAGRDHVFVGTGDSSFIDVFAFSGKKVNVIRTSDGRARTATEAQYEGAVDELVSNVRGSQMSTRIRTALLALPRPTHLPAYSAVLGDSEGLLWVTTSFPGDARTRCVIIDAAGRHVAEVDLIDNVRITDVGLDYIVGIQRDKDGEPHVKVFRLSRRA